ncbi:hypothetical protein [Streptomyces sp. NPDC051173]|uniref:hypothetical protein n=1 Tax=Streptomyces sp. NPDC051173 TaxID=3155164 RepID=UPI00344D9A0A
MTGNSGGPVFHGPVHDSQLAWNNRSVTQALHTAAGPDVQGLAEATRLIRTGIGQLALAPDREAEVLRAVDSLDSEIQDNAPRDIGRLRILADRLTSALLGAAAASVTAGAAEWASSLVATLHQALP